MKVSGRGVGGRGAGHRVTGDTYYDLFVQNADKFE